MCNLKTLPSKGRCGWCNQPFGSSASNNQVTAYRSNQIPCSWSAQAAASSLTMMTYSVAPHLNPTPADVLPKPQNHDNTSLQGKSVELAGSGVTSVFPTRLDHNVGSNRGPNWLAGFLYWLRRKERGMSKLAGRHFTVMLYKSLLWLVPDAALWRNLQTCRVHSKAHFLMTTAPHQ